jgi:hypothetical protein
VVCFCCHIFIYFSHFYFCLLFEVLVLCACLCALSCLVYMRLLWCVLFCHCGVCVSMVYGVVSFLVAFLCFLMSSFVVIFCCHLLLHPCCVGFSPFLFLVHYRFCCCLLVVSLCCCVCSMSCYYYYYRYTRGLSMYL